MSIPGHSRNHSKTSQVVIFQIERELLPEVMGFTEFHSNIGMAFEYCVIPVILISNHFYVVLASTYSQ